MDGLIEDYMAFMPYNIMAEKHNVSITDIIEWIEDDLATERAKTILDKLEDLDESFPKLIKEAIWKLQVIRFIASKYASNTIHDLNVLERISNYAIKARLEDYSTWSGVEYDYGLEVTIISNEHKLDISWVIAMGDGTLKSLENYAKSLRDKVSLQDSIKERVVYKDWEGHCKRCKVIGVSPKEYTENEAKELEQTLKDMGEL